MGPTVRPLGPNSPLFRTDEMKTAGDEPGLLRSPGVWSSEIKMQC